MVVDCLLGGFIGIWREWYWGALEQREAAKWAIYVAQFSLVALLSCWISGYSQYVVNLISLGMRTKLTKRAMELEKFKHVEGWSQRVQEDCLSYPILFINLISGVIRSIIMIVIFAVIIIMQLNVLYLLIPIVYSVVGTLIAGRIAIPLINLNYVNQVLEAKFRQVVSKPNYVNVHNNNYKLFVKTKHLQYFQSFYNQITVIIPHLILISLYFTGKITFGIFMQIASSMAEIINNLSFILNSFSDINRFLSCRKRLKELTLI